MKQPEFHLPNSLVVLKKYRKKANAPALTDPQMGMVGMEGPELVLPPEDPA